MYSATLETLTLLSATEAFPDVATGTRKYSCQRAPGRAQTRGKSVLHDEKRQPWQERGGGQPAEPPPGRDGTVLPRSGSPPGRSRAGGRGGGAAGDRRARSLPQPPHQPPGSRLSGCTPALPAYIRVGKSCPGVVCGRLRGPAGSPRAPGESRRRRPGEGAGCPRRRPRRSR